MNKDHAQRMLEHLATSMVNADEVGVGGAGKVFHTKAHKRMYREKYYTPAWAVRALLRVENFYGSIWEPAAGNGNIARELIDRFNYHVSSSDIMPDAEWIGASNFLTTDKCYCANIVTNPPFGPGGRLAFQFCWHALRLTGEGHRGKVAMLLRDDFDSAKGRRALFADHPAFDKKIVLTDRVRWTNLPQDPKKSPSGAHAWFVWDWTREPGPARLYYQKADEDPLTAALRGYKGEPDE